MIEMDIAALNIDLSDDDLWRVAQRAVEAKGPVLDDSHTGCIIGVAKNGELEFVIRACDIQIAAIISALLGCVDEDVLRDIDLTPLVKAHIVGALK